MLEELVASLVVSPVGAPAPGCLPASSAATQDADASQVDTRYPAIVAQWTLVSPPMSPVQGPPQVMLSVETRPDLALVGSATPGGDGFGYHRCCQLHSIPSDDLCWQMPQTLHRANHKGEAAATPGAARCFSPQRTYTARAPQEEQADSGIEHITYPGVQAR
jgi:hypothetical protein